MKKEEEGEGRQKQNLRAVSGEGGEGGEAGQK